MGAKPLQAFDVLFKADSQFRAKMVAKEVDKQACSIRRLLRRRIRCVF